MTKIIIKPRYLSEGEAISEQIITLPHPKTQIPVRYLIQKSQLLQIIKINDSYKKRSWFVNNSIVKDGTLYLATPFDLVFFIIPVLEKACNKEVVTSGSLGKYLLMDDILELFSEYHFPILISYLKPQMKQAIRSVCQKLESTRPFFRFDETLLLKVLVSKAKKIASHLPKSIEFEAITKHFIENAKKKELDNKDKNEELENIIELARLRTAMQFINSYLPTKYENLLLQSEDFTPLSLYLQNMQIHRVNSIFIQNTNYFTNDCYLKKNNNTIFEIKNNKKRKLKNNDTEMHEKNSMTLSGKNNETITISSASSVDLLAELSRVRDKFEQEKSGKLNKTRDSNQSRKKLLTRSNIGVEFRAAKDELDQQENILGIKIEASKAALKQKAIKYEMMRRGAHDMNVKGLAAENLLVDFDKKWAEQQELDTSSSSESNETDEENNPWIEYIDEFGRTRTIRKIDLPRQATPEQDTVPENLIYGDFIQTFNPDKEKIQEILERPEESLEAFYDSKKEIRTKGVGFYQFSKDAKKRKEERDTLKAEHKFTELMKQNMEQAYDRRKRKLDERKKEIERKRRKNIGEQWLNCTINHDR
ncbi:hypothetical protein PORY_000740 [Pneumocystis oryctolagi]|uniref:Uncharacterized protein n=1 Tax=Pneumocystis oryctolagi TaxID=42067 RepID=A0ACB7CFI7_9ASCO|nr:hypothetical protein PORY_000740 [Pneumocystis oryctolagi]